MPLPGISCRPAACCTDALEIVLEFVLVEATLLMIHFHHRAAASDNAVGTCMKCVFVLGIGAHDGNTRSDVVTTGWPATMYGWPYGHEFTHDGVKATFSASCRSHHC
jgi:hypothetical protein